VRHYRTSRLVDQRPPRLSEGVPQKNLKPSVSVRGILQTVAGAASCLSWAQLRPWTTDLAGPNPARQGAARGRWNSRTTGGHPRRGRQPGASLTPRLAQGWRPAWARGREAWRAQPRPTGLITRRPDRRHVGPERLSHGAEAYGCRGALWPCARVAPVRGAAFGGSSHQAHGARLWKRLDWPPPPTAQRARPNAMKR